MKVRLGAVCAGLIVLAGCGGQAGPHAVGSAKPASSASGTSASGTSASASAAQSQSDQGSATLTVQSFGFGSPITVNPGEPINVVNSDAQRHTVASGSAFKVQVGPGATASFTAPTVPGSYPLTCDCRTNMRSLLKVRGI